MRTRPNACAVRHSMGMRLIVKVFKKINYVGLSSTLSMLSCSSTESKWVTFVQNIFNFVIMDMGITSK